MIVLNVAFEQHPGVPSCFKNIANNEAESGLIQYMVKAPTTTYRIQFNKEFTFSDLEKRIPYLTRLGIGAIYASPVFKALPGSTHGYDQTDPLQINPEIGTVEQLRAVAKKLSAAGIGWIQDIVPNHMAFHSENEWLWDVLEKGRESRVAHFFDTVYAAPAYFSGRPMVPFLDAPLDEVIAEGRLTIQGEFGGWQLEHNGQRWPINTEGKRRIVEFLRAQGEKETISGTDAWPESLIHEVIACQHYELCWWRETEHRINYRRFFTVNGLLAVNVQDETVFRSTHRLIAELVSEGVFTGLRVDHVDGLADPTEYVVRLRRLVGEHTYLVVEKILQEDEAMPTYWPVQGSTGYDFLAITNRLLTDASNERRLSRFYDKLAGHTALPSALIAAKRAQLHTSMQGELNNLSRFFCDAVLRGKEKREVVADRTRLQSVLASFVVHCPVYRWYGSTFPLPEAEAESVRNTLQRASLAEPELREGFSLLESYLAPAFISGAKARVKQLSAFYQRCMQLTGALMAKGLEDTLMYTYHRFTGANEVGGSPAAFSLSIDDFHRIMQDRAKHHPLSQNATATHDTKRGEDARARLQVLSAQPRHWLNAVKRWMKVNASLKTGGMPDANDEYFIYQTLWGSYPMPGQSVRGYRERLEAYLVKALREAKRHTDWTNPDLTYEMAVRRFIRRILRPETLFMVQFTELLQKSADAAIVHSLAQVVLKFTCPGIPDIYQGCEGWDLSFVDPDNRRPVDFLLRRKWQRRLEQSGKQTEANVDDWWQERYSGLLKYVVTERLTGLRKSQAALFQGKYVPVAVTGKYRKRVVAYIRQHNDQWLLVVVPIRVQKQELIWESTQLLLPEGAPKRWRDVFTGAESSPTRRWKLEEALHRLPMGVWTASEPTDPNPRSAGLLMPLFSLPGSHGVGDLGPEAYRFADFLSAAKQRHWLMLPHNPTDEGVGYSPYSSRSAMAGNPLLISLDEFQRQGWIDLRELTENSLPVSNRVDYAQARTLKHFFSGKAFRNYVQRRGANPDSDFDNFCAQEAYWLDDYATYTVLRERYRGKPWYNWPRNYRMRDIPTMDIFQTRNARALLQVKWLQYQFHRQWKQLKTYCNEAGIRLIGDLPFYINHDSADVWTHPELFRLDDRGQLTERAGVPPDYFNVDGQDWGMPLYRWEHHAEQGYAWWIARVRRNLAHYDLLRLDHFRAFHDFWEIPRQAKTAKEGRWQTGPGKALFLAVKEAIGELPFIAEDLGDIHEGVYRLRDELGLPGMKVLQFAFGDTIGTNLHAPHLHTSRDIVFTGTHDNNTVAGWYRDELSMTIKRQLEAYLGVSRIGPRQASRALCRLAYSSPAALAILPVQDLLQLGSEARMNVPADPEANWRWRLKPGQLTERIQRQLCEWVQLYGR